MCGFLSWNRIFIDTGRWGLFLGGIAGLSVGIMWPGTISISSSKIPLGGTALFALLAMAGDMGGSIGPFVIGFVTQNTGDDLKAGMLAGCIFPAVLILSVFLLRQRNAEQK